MDTTLYGLIVTILVLPLSTNIFVSSSKYHQCFSSMEAEKALKKYKESSPCSGKLVSNHDLERLPQVISEIVCPAEAGERCIQLVLPMSVISVSNAVDDQVQNIIYVRSGCIDSHDVKKQKKSKSAAARESRKNNKISRRTAHSRSS